MPCLTSIYTIYFFDCISYMARPLPYVAGLDSQTQISFFGGWLDNNFVHYYSSVTTAALPFQPCAFCYRLSDTQLASTTHTRHALLAHPTGAGSTAKPIRISTPRPLGACSRWASATNLFGFNVLPLLSPHSDEVKIDASAACGLLRPRRYSIHHADCVGFAVQAWMPLEPHLVV